MSATRGKVFPATEGARRLRKRRGTGRRRGGVGEARRWNRRNKESGVFRKKKPCGLESKLNMGRLSRGGAFGLPENFGSANSGF
jgi:hypothetical protein